MKKIEILTSIPYNLMLYNSKNLCQHVKHILFYFRLKYEAI
jgi:hypothetical protein